MTIMERAIATYLTSEGCPPTLKASAINTKYKDWWYVPGHRQHTVIMELYEDCEDKAQG